MSVKGLNGFSEADVGGSNFTNSSNLHKSQENYLKSYSDTIVSNSKLDEVCPVLHSPTAIMYNMSIILFTLLTLQPN